MSWACVYCVQYFHLYCTVGNQISTIKSHSILCLYFMQTRQVIVENDRYSNSKVQAIGQAWKVFYYVYVGCHMHLSHYDPIALQCQNLTLIALTIVK
jgi:hypothetical protein